MPINLEHIGEQQIISSTQIVSAAHGLDEAIHQTGIWASRALWLGWIPLVLFLVFFTSMPAIHNGMHGLRHASTLVQCH